MLLASEHWFGPAPADWSGYRWGGFTAWAPPGAALDSEVVRYLDDGKPPILVTLGTSAASDAADRFRRLRDDLLAIGERPLLLTGTTVELGALVEEPGVFPFAPIDLVAPRCSAAVLSGALGSLAATARAGLPTVVHPQLFDQVWNAGQAERLGIGLHARSTRRVAGAVRRVLDDPDVGRRAHELAKAMEGEDGASACADAVEDLLALTRRISLPPNSSAGTLGPKSRCSGCEPVTRGRPLAAGHGRARQPPREQASSRLTPSCHRVPARSETHRRRREGRPRLCPTTLARRARAGRSRPPPGR